MTPTVTPEQLVVLADVIVQLLVRATPAGPEPGSLEIGGELAAVGFSSPARAQEGLSKAPGYGLIAMPLAGAMANLPVTMGIVVDPGTPEQLHVPSALREQVLDAGLPFPDGAPVSLGEPEQEPTALMDAVCELAPSLPSLQWVRRSWYHVGAREPRLLLTFGCAQQDVPQAMGLLGEAARRAAYPGRIAMASQFSLPEDVTLYLEDQVLPFYLTAP